ncbi:MAG: response regulator [Campylobacterales bacterium]|nr:response regulator [Campylobacterales bacterium]
MQYGTESQKRVSASINKSGKQRMYSQKILAYSFIFISEPEKRSETKELLLKLLKEVNDSNKELINGTDELTSALELSDNFYSLYYQAPVNINQKLKRFIYEVHDLLKEKPEDLTIDNFHLKNIERLSQPLMKAFDRAVTEYEQVAVDDIQLRTYIRIANLAFTFMIIYLLAKYIFFPLITKVKTREEELIEKEKFSNIVIESNENGIIAINSKSEVIVFNSAAEKIFGYSKEEMLGLDSLQKIIPKPFFKAHDDSSRNYLKGKGSKGLVHNKHKLQAVRKSGELFDIEIAFGSEIYNNEIIVVANVADITEDIKRLNEITELNRELKRSLASEKSFLASMSHEIRTPLNSVIGFLNLLDEARLTGDVGEWIKKANVSSDHLMSLINDVLDVSKIQANQMEIAEEKIDLEKILEECLTIISSRIKEDVTLEREIDKINYYLRGDSSRIKQILLNILGNASKFTAKGFVKLSLKNIKESEKTVSFHIDIADTGKGIDKEKVSTLFGAFKQVSAKDEGTGLGLFISNNLAQLMNGDLSVESEVGKGTIFTLALELKKDSKKEKESPESVIEKKVIYEDFSDLKVLVVDDVKMNIVLAKAIFKKNFNIVFEEAYDGEEAVNKTKEKDYDIIFMDIQMPVMDGITATREIRKFDKQIKIIAMTANAYAEHKEEAFEAGMNGYITKPISKPMIEEVLSDLKKGKTNG